MSLKPEIIDAMVAAGCSAEQIAAVVKASMAGKSTNAERQRRYRERHRNVSNVTERNGDVTNATEPSPSLPKRKVSPCTPSKENNPLSPTSSHPSDVRTPEARKRGNRVDGFEPEIATAVEMGLTPERARLQSEKFLDYWRGKPGKDGVKLDWPATWRNWVRSEVERHGSGPPLNGNVRAFPQPNRPLTPMEAYEARKAARGPVA